jgi:hypothetical protein
MLRGQGVLWEQNPALIPVYVDWEIEGMARMFRARQRGTERARNEYDNINAKVFHAIEFNKLWWNDSGTRRTMMESGIPCVAADVITKTRLDLSSWSAYDGRWTNSSNPHGHALWKGLEMAKYFTNETGEVPFNTPVQVGEFALNENPPYNGNNNQSVIENRYGRYIGVALGLDIPNFYLWNLYGSGQQGGPAGFTWEKDTQYDDAFLYQWLDGKWIIEPDGSWGFAAAFLMEQWANLMDVNDLTAGAEELFLYPNPTSEFFRLNDIKSPAIVSIIDTNGKLVTSFNHQPGSTIDVSYLQSGVYYVKVLNSDIKNKTIKLIIK